ncbi:MAG: MBL fold metallo-hydrolase [Bacteroidetes bacterium]|nr:MBL fold metallo-hydrolase [Bacteroidota bacterium]
MKLVKTIPFGLVLAFAAQSCSQSQSTAPAVVAEIQSDTVSFQEGDSLIIQPVQHATMVLQYGKLVIYVDPVGGAEAFNGMPAPDLVLVTDIHGDHTDANTLAALNLANAHLVAPNAVMEMIGNIQCAGKFALLNGDSLSTKGIQIHAIPMYNLREDALKFHPKGRGNGYVITINGERIYLSGDTEDIPEMRKLTSIDRAFVCMNLPYTMTVDQAADAVIAFKPATVYPYHYRGKDGLSDVNRFAELIHQRDSTIQVELLNWYP